MCAWFKKAAEKIIGSGKSATGSSDVTSGRTRRVTIGLDFGTSTSKCCFREAIDRKPFVFVAFDRPGGAARSTLFDTAVASNGSDLLFGPDAADEADAIRSFKMCLACQADTDTGRSAATRCPRCHPDVPGLFRIAGIDISAEDLCTLHLSVMLSEVLRVLPTSVGAAIPQLRLTLNAAAPLDQLRQFGTAGPYFDRVMFYALKLAESGAPRRRWRASAAMDALRAGRQEPMPDEAHSRTKVYPETHAAMTGFLLLPDSEPGLYGLLDIGAGTTDVSFFWFQKNQAGTCAWYYATGTTPRGMDDVDRALAGVLKVPASQLRRAREARGEDWIADQGPRFADVSRDISSHFERVHWKAREVDQRDWAWIDKGTALFRTFLVGGGCGCSPLVERIRRAPPQGMNWSVGPSQLLVPEHISVVDSEGDLGTLGSRGYDHERPLLLLAYGLSHPRQDMIKFARDTEGVVVVRTERAAVSHEDIYGR